jgi:nucleotide-binding universal stress UspA family protein
MTRPAPLLLRRILVALDASPGSMEALRAAVDLAARTEAELHGLFVEDVGVLRLASAPFAREMFVSTATEAPVTQSSMEVSLRSQSRRIERELAAVADRAHVTWRFRSVRGSVTEEILAAAAGADLIAIGNIGWSIGALPRFGSTARQLLASSVPVLLLPGNPPAAPFHFVAYFDGTLAAQHALLGAAYLAGQCQRGLTVLVAAAGREDAALVRRQAEELLQGRTMDVRYRQLDPDDAASVRRALAEERGGILVLGTRDGSPRIELLESVALNGEIPLLLLDGR